MAKNRILGIVDHQKNNSTLCTKQDTRDSTQRYFVSFSHNWLVLISFWPLFLGLLFLGFPFISSSSSLLAEEGPEEWRVHVVNHLCVLEIQINQCLIPTSNPATLVEEHRDIAETSSKPKPLDLFREISYKDFPRVWAIISRVFFKKTQPSCT